MALTPTRKETAANWASSDPVLVKGEVGIETDTGIVKVGDGIRHWSTLNVADNQETSAAIAADTSDETGTGAAVFATSPSIVSPAFTTPTLGVATATSLNKITVTAPATGATLTLAEGSTLATVGAYTTTITATATTGVTLPTTGTLATLAGAETLTNKSFTLAKRSVTDAIAASATQTQAAGTALTTDINRVVTIATTGDAVTLPAAVAGRTITVINAHATNAVGIFPALGDAINAIAANGVYSLAATKSADFVCAVAGTWNTILSA